MNRAQSIFDTKTLCEKRKRKEVNNYLYFEKVFKSGRSCVH